MLTPEQVARIDARLATLLPPESLYAVGGRVRDELRAKIERIEIPLKDLDYVVVGMPLDELIVAVRSVGRAELTGASFAVVKVTLEGTTVDIALPRRERSTGQGHRDFEVEAGPRIPLEDDLARRDFRLNMIARSIASGTVVDPYDGEADIRARRIDLLRPQAFVEDPLRILRAVQFAARFGYTVTASTLEAMKASADLIVTVSAERIRDEFVKLLSAPRPSSGIEMMRETGVLLGVLPELLEGHGVEQNEWHAHDVYRHNLATLDAAAAADMTLRLAALLHDIGKPRTKDGPHFYRHESVGAVMARAILQRLKFSTETVETVENLVQEHMYVANPEHRPAVLRRFVRRVGLERLERQFALRHADIAGSGLPKRDDSNERFEARVAEIIAERPAFSIKDLTIDGNDVIQALVEAKRMPPGFRGGPLVGRVLQHIFEEVTDDPNCNERTQLLIRMRQVVKMFHGEQ